MISLHEFILFWDNKKALDSLGNKLINLWRDLIVQYQGIYQ